MTPVRPEPAAPWSRVKHSTTELPPPKKKYMSREAKCMRVKLLLFSYPAVYTGVLGAVSWIYHEFWKRDVFVLADTVKPVFLCLFDLILYVPSTIFQLNRDRSSWVEPVQS